MAAPDRPLPEPLRGIVPPLVTPLVEDELDPVGLHRLVDRLVDGGVSGLFVLGTTGEGPSLSYRLRRALLDAVVTRVAQRVPVLVGVTDTSLSEAIDATKWAAVAGAQAVVYAPPCYFPISQSALADSVRRLADQSPLPVMLYNMPSLTKSEFDVDTVHALMSEPNVVGVKDSSGDLQYYRRLVDLKKCHSGMTVMAGPEHLLADTVLLGGDGGVCGGANIYPQLFVDLFRAADTNDTHRVAALQRKVEQLGRLYTLSCDHGVSVIQGVKAALAALGVCGADLCQPYGRLSGTHTECVAEILSDLGLFHSNGQHPSSKVASPSLT